jgi:hypothetical protein
MRKIMLAYIIIAVLALCIVWFIFIKKDYRIGRQGMMDKYVNLLADNALKGDWKKLNCTVNLSASLVQCLHIVWDNGRVVCAEELRGEFYDKLKKPFSCTPEDAERIDEAVRKKEDCTFSVSAPINEGVLNYHALVLVCVADFTNWTYVGGRPCPLEYPQSVIYAVVDDKGNVFY